MIKNLLLALVFAASAFALEPVDPTLWRLTTETYGPAENPSGATGNEPLLSGNVGRTDLGFWSWNVAGQEQWRIIPASHWETYDATKNTSGGPTGVTTDAKWVEISGTLIFTPGSAPGEYYMDTSWRKFGSPFQNYEQITHRTSNPRTPFTITVPLSQGKFQFSYHAGMPVWAAYPVGAAWGGHFFINKWAR